MPHPLSPLSALAFPFESPGLTLAAVLGAIILSLVILYLVAHLIGWLLRTLFGLVAMALGLLGGLVGRAGLFIGREIQDALHLAGGVVSTALVIPLTLLSGLMGHMTRAADYAASLGGELLGVGRGLYRVALGNPLWLLGLDRSAGKARDRLTRTRRRLSRAEIRDRLRAKYRDRLRAKYRGRLRGMWTSESGPLSSRSATARFDGYRVSGELEPGGSGARLYLAHPTRATLERYRSEGLPLPEQVVIKCFDVAAGSTLPQIVRESRSLEAARSLGLVLDHDLSERRFWYAMPYVPGEDLDVVTRRMHARCGPEGLDELALRRVLGYTADLLTSLERFHAAGLWHKDIKPGNLIISGERAHLVDLGLVTPLASAMTLTTHGTEYYRDPELVRRALKGARVRDVDGVRFDLYSAGAVLYSMLENSFPAHGNLSRMEKRCPPALALIVRRAMADLSQRYRSADEMRADIEALIAAQDPWEVRPADLPSMDSGERAGSGERTQPAAVPPSEHRSTLADELPPLRPRPLSTPPVPTPPPPRRRGILGVAATLCAVLFLAFGFLSLGRTVSIRAESAASSFERNLVIPAPAAPTYQGVAVDAAGRAGVSTRAAAPDPHGAAAPKEWVLVPAGEIAPPAHLLVVPSAGLAPGDPRLEETRKLLRKRGYHLESSAGGPASIERMARAQSAIGLRSPSSAEGAQRLRELLEKWRDLDAIVWLGPGEDGGADCRVVTRKRP